MFCVHDATASEDTDLRVVGVTGLRSPPHLLGFHPIALHCGIMFTAVKENRVLTAEDHGILNEVQCYLCEEPSDQRISQQDLTLWAAVRCTWTHHWPHVCSTDSISCKDIFDLFGLQWDRSVLTRTVTVGLSHDQNQVTVGNLLHHKHPETQTQSQPISHQLHTDHSTINLFLISQKTITSL